MQSKACWPRAWPARFKLVVGQKKGVVSDGELTTASRRARRATARKDQTRQSRSCKRTRYRDYEERLSPVARIVPYRMEEDVAVCAKPDRSMTPRVQSPNPLPLLADVTDEGGPNEVVGYRAIHDDFEQLQSLPAASVVLTSIATTKGKLFVTASICETV